LKYTILRVSSPVTTKLTHMPPTVLTKWIKCGLNGRPLQIYGSGKRSQDFIMTSEIARAFLCSTDNLDAVGIYNIASGSQISMMELAHSISDKFGNAVEFYGPDVNENDRWNISVDKAEKELQFKPRYSSKETILNVLNNLTE